MAKNLVYRNTDSQNRVETLAATYQSGRPVISLGAKSAVTVTASGDATKSEVIPGVGTLSGVANGGVGLVGKQVTLAFDGTWEWPATEFDDTIPVPASMTQGTLINFRTASGKLTTTGVTSGVVAYGYIDIPPDYDRTRGYVPVRIGTR